MAASGCMTAPGPHFGASSTQGWARVPCPPSSGGRTDSGSPAEHGTMTFGARLLATGVTLAAGGSLAMATIMAPSPESAPPPSFALQQPMPSTGRTMASAERPAAEPGPANTGPANTRPANTGWGWPTTESPGRVARGFDPPLKRWLSGHRGVDLTAAVGDPVLSPAPGRVMFSGTVVDRGVITIDHGGGLLSSFESVAEGLEVGERVAEGTVLGIVEAPGHCAEGCLHWGVRRNGEYVDPLRYLRDRRPSVLLPLN